jgi:hypothetical protein
MLDAMKLQDLAKTVDAVAQSWKQGFLVELRFCKI